MAIYAPIIPYHAQLYFAIANKRALDSGKELQVPYNTMIKRVTSMALTLFSMRTFIAKGIGSLWSNTEFYNHPFI